MSGYLHITVYLGNFPNFNNCKSLYSFKLTNCRRCYKMGWIFLGRFVNGGILVYTAYLYLNLQLLHNHGLSILCHRCQLYRYLASILFYFLVLGRLHLGNLFDWCCSRSMKVVLRILFPAETQMPKKPNHHSSTRVKTNFYTFCHYSDPLSH